MSTNIQTTLSQVSLSTHSTPGSFSEHHPRSSTAHLVRSNSAKTARGGSLGLIDAARVRFSKDFPSLLRANSKSHRPKSSLLPQVRVSEIDLSALPDYAKRSNSDLAHTGNDPLMDGSGVQNERHGRSLGSRIVNFLSRSRSRSRSKKRSQSVDATQRDEVPSVPAKSVGSLGRHTRHASYRDEQPSTSTSTSASGSLSKPSTRTKSRPLSSTPTPSNTTAKQHTKALPEIPSTQRSFIPTSSQLLSPQPRPAMVHILNSPPLPRGEFGRGGLDAPDSGDYGGRCSPLCLSTPRFTPPGSRNKGKEKERPRSAKERELSAIGDKDRDRITAPRRVGSPLLREQARESRTTIAPIPVDRVASGGGQSRRSSGRESAAANVITVAKVKRIKHGSFDFERPISSAKQDPFFLSKSALKSMGIGSETQSPSMIPAPMMRSTSMQANSRPAGNGTAYAKPLKQSSTPPDSFGRSKRPYLGLGLQSTPKQYNSKPHRQGTGDSNGSSSHASHSAPAHRTHFVLPDADPSSPASSHSENSSSWGKSGGKHITRASHGAFKFEPAVPTIPGSPASDERRSAARGPPRPSNLSNTPTPTASPSPTSPTKLRSERAKGRSLDLGLGLSWAPSRVREEAVLPRGNPSTTASTSRAKGRYKGAWVQRDGRYELGLDNGQSPVGADVAKAFNDALGDAAYSTFKLFVHRFDAHAIPLDGPYGLIYHARRLLDEANTLDERSKRVLVDRFVRFVQETQ
ncbi:hypothetical protein QCA50_001314 [Cerrena zonata]|uniref:Uncharacterized protein n=1 Tax=Cerrena zonata TaxID=2478898 RepID=A0AAW0GVG8_9APHY